MRKGDVYAVTHNLSLREKGYISFSFDGVEIEDYGWVRVSGGSRYSGTALSESEYITTEVTGKAGQLYWGRRDQPKSLTFQLATDGATQQQLLELQRDFGRDKVGTLILSEFPNRCAKARISNPITMTVVPFEEEIERFGVITRQTLYKGEAEISFTLDDPYWYAKEQQIDKEIGAMTEQQQHIAISENIPFKFPSGIAPTDVVYCGEGGRAYEGGIYKNVDLSVSSTSLYNGGTVASRVKLSFSLPLVAAAGTDGRTYVATIGNDYLPRGGKPYNKITIGGNHIRYTLPLLWYSVNQVIYLSAHYTERGIDKTAGRLESIIREEVENPIARSWAMRALEEIKGVTSYYDAATGNFKNNTWLSAFNTKMLSYLQSSPIALTLDGIKGIATFSTTCATAQGTGSAAIQGNCSEIMVAGRLEVKEGSHLNEQGMQALVPFNSDVELQHFSISYSYTYI